MLENRPKTVTINNLPQFFNFLTANPGSIKKGMLVQFNYSSPENPIHDRKPLVFVMENYGDRIIGLNLHYQFNAISGLLMIKDNQLKEFLQKSNEYKKYLDELKKNSKVDLSKGNLENPVDIKKETPQFDYKKVKFPQLLLEDFTSDIKVSDEIFRNYLFKRMNTLRKLSFKI